MLCTIQKTLKWFVGALLLLIGTFRSYVLVVDGPMHSLSSEILPPLFGFVVGGYLVYSELKPYRGGVQSIIGLLLLFNGVFGLLFENNAFGVNEWHPAGAAILTSVSFLGGLGFMAWGWIRNRNA